MQGSWGLCERGLWAVANKGGLRLESKRSGERMVSNANSFSMEDTGTKDIRHIRGADVGRM